MSQDLPKGWLWAVLGDLCKNHDGTRVPVKASNRLEMRGQYPYYGASGVIDHVNDYLFEGTYLLISEDGANLLARSKPIAFEATGRFWVNNHAHVVTARQGICQRYLMHAIDCSDIRPFITGSAQPKITQRNLSKVPVPVPPTAGQERIVAAIEEHFSRLAAVESSLRQALQRLDVLRSAVLIDAFHAHRDLPPAWRACTIGDVADVQLGRQRSPQYHTGEQMRPYLRSANVTWNGISLDDVKAMNFDDADFEKYRLEPGDLLLNEASGSPNEVGKPTLWDGEISDCCFQNTLLRLRPHGVILDYLYWYCYASALSGRFGEAGRGVNIRHLGKQGLAQFPIPVPPRHEQAMIAERIRAAVERAESLRRSLREAIARVAALRRSVLAEAFAGRLVPQDRNDEPASVLLERIAASRSTKPNRCASARQVS